MIAHGYLIQVHNDYMKKQALEREDIYRTPTPNCPADSTWLQEKEYEVCSRQRCLMCDYMVFSIFLFFSTFLSMFVFLCAFQLHH